jgi:hypothetical protein
MPPGIWKWQQTSSISRSLSTIANGAAIDRDLAIVGERTCDLQRRRRRDADVTHGCIGQPAGARHLQRAGSYREGPGVAGAGGPTRQEACPAAAGNRTTVTDPGIGIGERAAAHGDRTGVGDRSSRTGVGPLALGFRAEVAADLDKRDLY